MRLLSITDEAVMKSLGIRNFDHVIVAIGENIRSITLTTLILKELGVKKVTAKAQNDYHAKILNKIETVRLCTLSVIWVDVLRIMCVQVYLIILSWQTAFCVVELKATEKMAGQSSSS